jgi:hypothetical protein
MSLQLGERSLLVRVRDRVARPIWKHRSDDLTDEQIQDRVNAEINSWSMLALLEAISFELEEAEHG